MQSRWGGPGEAGVGPSCVLVARVGISRAGEQQSPASRTGTQAGHTAGPQ